jgi:plastocyanin
MPKMLRATAVAFALLLTLTACGGSTEESPKTSQSSQTPSNEESTGAPTDATAAGSPILSDGEAPADRTITISKNGFSPQSLEIAAGENVTFKAEGEGVFAVDYGEGSDSATVTGGLIETFTFPGPGTYTFTDSFTGIPMTVTVK